MIFAAPVSARRFAVLGASLLLSALASCHSGKAKRDPHAPLTWSERSSGKGDKNKVSGFDKMIKTSAIGDRGAMKLVGSKSYSTSSFKGGKDYKGSKDFQTKEYAGVGKMNRAQNQLSSLGGKTSKAAGKTFATNDSRWSGKTADANNKTFSGSGQQYKTSEFSEAAKSLESNKRPYFQPAHDLDKTKTYAEEDVKALLNRN